jgi:hypothetical protein
MTATMLLTDWAQRAFGERGTATQTPDNATTMAFLKHVAGYAQLVHLPHDQQVGTAIWFLGQTIYAQANILAYRDGFLITAIVFTAALLPICVLDRARR